MEAQAETQDRKTVLNQVRGHAAVNLRFNIEGHLKRMAAFAAKFGILIAGAAAWAKAACFGDV